MSDFLKPMDRHIAKWVSMDDALPPTGKDYGTGVCENVLCHVTTMPGVSFGEIRIGSYDKKAKRWKDAWLWNVDLEFCDGENNPQQKIVTHWMELPKSPYISHPNPGPHTVNP